MSYSYTNDKLKDIRKNKLHSGKIIDFYVQMSNEFTDFKDKYLNKSHRLLDCMFFWDWEKYEQHKTLDLKKLNRCKDKYCSNCKQIAVASSLFEVLPIFKALVDEGYKPLLFTLTVPNVSADLLPGTIDKLFSKFKTFYDYFEKPINSRRSYKGRSYSIVGAIRALEITYNAESDTYHPHLHIMAFAIGDFVDLKKTMKYSKKINKKTKCEIGFQLSEADLEIRRLWTNLYNDKDQRTINKLNESDLYLCDVKEITTNQGILEALKYSCKNSEISSYEVFKTLYFALWNRKIKQGYGRLYSLKFDDQEDIKDDTETLFSDEVPQSIVLSLNDLISSYQNYEKISRFRARDLLPIVKNNLKD